MRNRWSRIKLWLGISRRAEGGKVNPITARNFHVAVWPGDGETGGFVYDRDSGDDAVTDAIVRSALPKSYLFPAMMVGQQALQDSMKMELLRAKMGIQGMGEKRFREVADRVITESRRRDWDWGSVLGRIEAACRDELYGPVLPDPQTVPYGTVINGYRAMGHPVRWELFAEKIDGDD